MGRKCCVPGCTANLGPWYGFPSNKAQCKVWMDRIKSPLFVGLTEAEEVVARFFCFQSSFCSCKCRRLAKFSLSSVRRAGFSGEPYQGTWFFRFEGAGQSTVNAAKEVPPCPGQQQWDVGKYPCAFYYFLLLIKIKNIMHVFLNI